MNGMKKPMNFSKGMKQHTEKYCIDCILKVEDRNQLKKKLNFLFQEIPKKNFEDERITTISQIASFLSHPQQLSIYNMGLVEFTSLLEAGNIIECLVKIISLKETGDADFDCCGYYSIAILIILIQKHDPFLGDDFNLKNVKQFYKNQGTTHLIQIINRKRYSFVENIKNLMLLRYLTLYSPIVSDMIKNDCLPHVFEMFNHTTKYVLGEIEKYGIKDNQKILLSMGVAGTTFTQSADPDTVKLQELKARALSRIEGMKENASMIISNHCLTKEGRNYLIERKYLNYMFEFLKGKCEDSSYQDLCFSFWIGLDNYVKSCEKEEIQTLHDLKLFNLVESWMYNPNAITQLSKIFSILKNLISKDPDSLKLLLKSHLNIIDLTRVYLHFRVGVVQTNSVKFYEELSKHKSSAKLISTVKDDCLFELIDDYNDEIHDLGKKIYVNFFKFGLRKKKFGDIKNFRMRGGKIPQYKKAEDYKKQGNDQFKQQNYEKAIELYDKGIECVRYFGGNSCLHMLYGNRSECSLRLKNYQQAVVDSLYSYTSRGDSNDIKDTFEIKVFIRLGKSLTEIGKNLEAVRCYYEVLYDHPRSKEVLEFIQDMKMKVKNRNICSFCKNYESTMMKCSICYEPYCSSECQKADWKEHKIICKK
eukprot:gene2995-5005_t